MLHALLEESTNLPAQKAQYFIGDEVPLPPGPQPFTVRKPDGTEVMAEGWFTLQRHRSARPLRGRARMLRFVVNVLPEESRTHR
jgi:tagatose-1,6-bisphosphate aldolase non-catalytic subunit AgaZ/GatZ